MSSTTGAVLVVHAFEALADSTRRRIVEALRGGELSVGEIVAEVGIAQSGVSRHLRILAESGFVHVRPDGQRRLYSLRPEPFLAIDVWMDEYRRLWGARLDRLGTELERKVRSRQENQ
jgi:DNA-binding transcriptional ArsR family regulator